MTALPSGFSTLPTFAQSCAIEPAFSVPILAPNGIQAWTHDASGVRIILFATAGPLVSTTIFVGTEPISNAGHPHTLEHIVFLGSHNHPQRGYLDTLAYRCMSCGTNAWTDTEFTAYTTVNAGFEGCSNLLPCYLDHVLRPKINEASFASEVYHIRKNGKEAGVVFCEMQGRENTEADLSEHALMETLFEGTPLGLAAAGLCKDISKLHNEDIQRFHYDQYCGANVSVVIGGQNVSPIELLASVKPLLDEIAAQPGYTKGQPMWRSPIDLKPLPPITNRIVPFPCPDADIGSLIIGWRGPSVFELETNEALYIIIRYLAHNVWSPLPQAFVEVKDQLAGDVDYGFDTYADTSAVSFIFSGVQHHGDSQETDDDEDTESEESEDDDESISDESESDGSHMEKEPHESFLLSGKLEKQVMALLEDIVIKGKIPEGIQAIHNCIDKEMEQHLTQLESGAHEQVPHCLIEEIVYGHRCSLQIGESVRGHVARLKSLKSRDEKYWISLIKKYLIDAPRVNILMVPDAELAEKLSKQEQLSVENRKNTLGEKALERMDLDAKKHMASLEKRQFSGNMFPKVPSRVHIPRWMYDVAQDRHTQYYIESVKIDSDFIHCNLLLDTSRIPIEQRIFLPLVAELLPSADVLEEDGSIIPYTENARRLSELTISGEDAGLCIGHDSDCGDQCVGIHFAAMPESFAEAAELMCKTFFQSKVTSERIAVLAQSAVAGMTSSMRDAEEVLESAVTQIPLLEKRGRNKGYIPNSILADLCGSYPMFSLLNEEFTKKQGDKKQEYWIQKIEDTISSLRNLSSYDIYLQITAKDPEKGHATFSEIWKRKREKFTTRVDAVSRETMKQRAMGRLPISWWRKLPSEKMVGKPQIAKIIGVAGVETSCFQVFTDTTVRVGDNDWPALHILLEMIRRIEGPLTNAIRGAGLAYDASISYSAMDEQICAGVAESSTPAAAWDALFDCLGKFGRELENESEEMVFDMDTARMGCLFSMHEERSTPDDIESVVLRRTAMGLKVGVKQDEELEQKVEEVTLGDVKRVFDRYVSGLGQEKGRMVVVVCGQGMVEETRNKFAKCKNKLLLQEMSVADLCSIEVKEVISKLKSRRV